MSAVSIAYIVFILLGLLSFAFLAPQRAVAVVYLSGLIFLPVSFYSIIPTEPADAAALPSYLIMTLALPANELVNKAAIAAITALIGALLFDHRRFLHFRPSMIDLPIAGWCLWPTVQSLFIVTEPVGWLSSIYLFVLWGVPWLLGRIYFSERAGRLLLADNIVALTLLLLPIAVIEGASGQRVYEWIFGVHPFADVGAERYLGYRPLAMFEDGNQYGLWVCCAALLAIWRVKTLPSNDEKKWRMVAAVALCILAVAAQSIGALLLMGAGIAILQSDRLLRYSRKMVVPALILLAISLAVYGSGIIPLRSIAKETAVGQLVMDALRATGRSSFAWRISQDQQTLPQIQEYILMGSGQWNWWLELGKRPWGLLLLLVGQFGLIGVFLALYSPIAAMFSRLRNTQFNQEREGERNQPKSGHSSALAFSIIVLITLADGLLNAFTFLPVTMFAGSLVLTQRSQKPSR